MYSRKVRNFREGRVISPTVPKRDPRGTRDRIWAGVFPVPILFIGSGLKVARSCLIALASLTRFHHSSPALLSTGEKGVRAARGLSFLPAVHYLLAGPNGSPPARDGILGGCFYRPDSFHREWALSGNPAPFVFFNPSQPFPCEGKGTPVPKPVFVSGNGFGALCSFAAANCRKP